jgi:hypothetical protein
MAGPEPPDVLGTDREEAPLGRARLLSAAAASLAVGFGLGLLWSGRESSDEISAVPSPRPAAPAAVQADGGLVEVCGGVARAYVFALGLPPGRTEVHLPLRGDGVLLPLLTADAEVLTGSPEDSQYFLAQDGQLIVAQVLPVPASDTIEAVVGEQRLTLAVRGCRGVAR